jgi:HK97 family phage prohead protease
VTTRKIESAPLYRAAALDSRAVDGEARTIDVAFSSETPVQRMFGIEVLDHTADSIRLDRMNSGGPVLMDHDTRDHVGVVESANVGPDRIARARIRFGQSQRAQEIWQDVQDGVRKHLSVGYRIHKMQLESATDDAEVYRATDWEPHEISIVSVPADPTVGIGRAGSDTTVNTIEVEGSREPEESSMLEQPAEQPTPDVDVVAIENKVREQELARISDLQRMGEQFSAFGGKELAEKMIRTGKSVIDMKDAVLERLPDSIDQQPQRTESVAKLDMTEKQVESYSLFRAISAHVNKNWKDAPFELECSRQVAERVGRDPRGFFVPTDIQQRVMVAAGNALKGTDHLADNFIDSLRPMSVAMLMGATVLDGLVGDVSIPKLAAGATFYWVAEDVDVTDSDGTLAAVTLTPKTVGGSVPISRKLLKQSAPSVEAVMMNDLRRGAALAIDLAALEGGGTNEPDGIINTTSVNTQLIGSAAAPTFAEMVGFETAVGTDNALEGALGYVTTSPIIGALKTTAKDTGSGIMVADGGQINGYSYAVRNGLTANSIIFGNFNDLLIGMWGILDVMPDEAAKAASGGLVLRVFQDVDVAVRHPESFCINTSA